MQGGSAFLRDLRFESMPSPADSTLQLGLRRCQGPESIVRNAIGSEGSSGDGQAQAALDQNSFRFGVQPGVSCDDEGAQLQHVSVDFVYLFTGQDMPADATDLDSMCAAGAAPSASEEGESGGGGVGESGGSASPSSGRDNRAQPATNSNGSPSQG